MKSGLLHIFNEGPCPDSKTLFAYLEGTLDTEQRFVLESHLLSCGFCTEALEAYRNEKSLSDARIRLTELEGRIQRFEYGSARRPEGRHTIYIKYAALLALVLISVSGLYFLLRDRNTEDLVVEAPVAKNAPGILREKSERQKPEPAKALTPESPAREDIPEDNESDASLNETFAPAQEADLEASATRNEALFSAEKTTKKTSVKTPVKDLPKETGSSLDESGKTISAEADQQIAEEKKESVLTEVATKQSAEIGKMGSYLDSAIEAYENGYYIHTISMLQHFSSPDKKETAKAQWYLANAYVQTRDYARARPVLETLASGSGSYARKARKLLEEIQTK
jgi:hypothetical protein